MALEIKLSQKLSQSLVMTPQLQQAIKLLQLGRLEYLEVVEKELLENPILEDARDEGVYDSHLAGKEISDGLSPSGDSSQSSAEANFEGAPSSQESSADSLNNVSFQDTPGWVERSDFSSDFSQGSRLSRGNVSADDLDERPSLEAIMSRPEGLATHLLWQLKTAAALSPEDEHIAVQIIGNLDRDGYLQISIEELSSFGGCTVADGERVLALIHSLDPAGVGGRNLRECLLIQLNQQGLEDSLPAKIVANFLHQLELRRYEVIARETNVSVEQVYEAVKRIQKLEPRPGRQFYVEPPVYITPDIYVRKVGDDYIISLNDVGIPKLRMSSRYRELLSSGRASQLPDFQYLQEAMRSAAWLIKSIEQRQQTIYRVTESIMKFQRGFLEHGVCALKPLVLRDVAEDVQMHESTISRVTTNKYVHTPQGVFELKFFFTSGLHSENGEVSSQSVKEKIRALIAAEDSRKPFSDQLIVERLRAEGIDIARRTVAKYREMMSILSSSRRKRHF